jgi:dolichol kinase
VSGALALVFYFFPNHENIFIFGLSVLIIITLLFDVIRLSFPHINDFVYEHLHFLFVDRDRHKINSANFYFMGCMITIVVFPVDIAAIGILYLSIGDTAAAIGGISLKKFIPFQIPRTTKTFIGSFVLIIVCFHIGILLGLSWQAALISAFIGALFEALPLGIDDNFTVPFFSALSIWLVIGKF